jgi:hypothetical protein
MWRRVVTNEPTDPRENVTNEPKLAADLVDACTNQSVAAIGEPTPTKEPAVDRENATDEPNSQGAKVNNDPRHGLATVSLSRPGFPA